MTPEEFRRGLDRALPGMDYRLDGDLVEVGDGAKGIAISVRALPPRRLSALLSLPRSEVRIAFHGYDAREQAAFLERFDRAYQRGGG